MFIGKIEMAQPETEKNNGRFLRRLAILRPHPSLSAEHPLAGSQRRQRPFATSREFILPPPDCYLAPANLQSSTRLS